MIPPVKGRPLKFVPKAKRERLAAESASPASAGKHEEETEVERIRRLKEERRERIRREAEELERQQTQNGSGSTLTVADVYSMKEPLGEKATAADIERVEYIHRYMGPPVNQFSKFSAKKKRMRSREDKFKFDWDASEDTTRQDDTAIKSNGKSLNAPYASYASLGGEFDPDAEERALKRARMIEERDEENAKEHAEEYMRNFYTARDRALQRAEKRGFGRPWHKRELHEMRKSDWRVFKENFGISTKGDNIPNPMRNWKESNLPSRLLEIVDDAGYKEPTPIQMAAIPIALQARDLIGVAVTGSGKTASFLLPLLVYISDLPPLTEVNKDDGPYALILAPTRELVQQIEKEALKFATPLGFRCVSIVGGHSLEEQAYALRNGAEIIVATPGRLIDCIERRLLVLSQCCYLIMDEADRMIDMGFEESVNKILDALPVTNEKPDTDDAENSLAMKQYLGGKDRYRQTMMYTATMPPLVEKIARKYLRRPATVTIGNEGQAAESVEQRVEFIAGEDRRKKRLQEILASNEFAPPIIVFVNVKHNCEAVARDVRSMGWSAVTLHGSKTQEQRESALDSIRSGNAKILVATDLAGRGIDLADVSLVINFNMPKSLVSYTHRIGRTGRAGKSGVAITFLGNEDESVMHGLKEMLSKSSISKVPEELKRHDAAQSARGNRI